MKEIAGRPIGIALIAVVLSINGISSIVVGGVLKWVVQGDVAVAVVSILIGLALLHRAYGIWNLRPGTWLVSLLVMGLRTVFTLWNIAIAPAHIENWIDLAVSVVTIVYLIRPEVRSLFLRKQLRY